jgi:GxxExxY protein
VEQALTEKELAKEILDCAFALHAKLGPGMPEPVYEIVLAEDLKKKGLAVERRRPMPILYDGARFDAAFRADLVVNEKVIVEVKAIERATPEHTQQVVAQLRMSGLKLGLLINFGELHLRNGIQTLINGRLDDPHSEEN